MNFTRKVVKHRDEKGRTVRVVVKESDNEVVTRSLKNICDVVIFVSQKDSTIHMVQKSLVDEIIIEEENPKYCTFHKIGNIDF